MNSIMMTFFAGMGAVSILLIALVLLGGIAALLGWFSKDDGKGITEGPSCDTCDGNDTRCEQVCMMEASVKPIELYRRRSRAV